MKKLFLLGLIGLLGLTGTSFAFVFDTGPPIGLMAIDRLPAATLLVSYLEVDNTKSYADFVATSNAVYAFDLYLISAASDIASASDLSVGLSNLAPMESSARIWPIDALLSLNQPAAQGHYLFGTVHAVNFTDTALDETARGHPDYKLLRV